MVSEWDARNLRPRRPERLARGQLALTRGSLKAAHNAGFIHNGLEPGPTSRSGPMDQ